MLELLALVAAAEAHDRVEAVALVERVVDGVDSRDVAAALILMAGDFVHRVGRDPGDEREWAEHLLLMLSWGLEHG